MPYKAYRFNVPNTNLTLEVGSQALRIVGGQEIGVDDTNLRYVFQEVLRLAERVKELEGEEPATNRYMVDSLRKIREALQAAGLWRKREDGQGGTGDSAVAAIGRVAELQEGRIADADLLLEAAKANASAVAALKLLEEENSRLRLSDARLTSLRLEVETLKLENRRINDLLDKKDGEYLLQIAELEADVQRQREAKAQFIAIAGKNWEENLRLRADLREAIRTGEEGDAKARTVQDLGACGKRTMTLGVMDNCRLRAGHEGECSPNYAAYAQDWTQRFIEQAQEPLKADAELGRSLVAILSGEKGESEGAVETLERIIREREEYLKAAGREQRSCAAAHLRADGIEGERKRLEEEAATMKERANVALRELLGDKSLVPLDALSAVTAVAMRGRVVAAENAALLEILREVEHGGQGGQCPLCGLGEHTAEGLAVTNCRLGLALAGKAESPYRLAEDVANGLRQENQRLLNKADALEWGATKILAYLENYARMAGPILAWHIRRIRDDIEADAHLADSMTFTISPYEVVEEQDRFDAAAREALDGIVERKLEGVPEKPLALHEDRAEKPLDRWFDGLSMEEVHAMLLNGRAPGSGAQGGAVLVPNGFLDWLYAVKRHP